jgi:hypothetical protein
LQRRSASQSASLTVVGFRAGLEVLGREGEAVALPARSPSAAVVGDKEAEVAVGG